MARKYTVNITLEVETLSSKPFASDIDQLIVGHYRSDNMRFDKEFNECHITIEEKKPNSGLTPSGA